MANDTVPTWLFPIVLTSFAAAIIFMYWWLDNKRKR